MTKKILILAVFATTLALATNASAVVFGDGGAALQGVFDSITVGPVAGSSSIDVNADQASYDETWSITGAGGSVSTIIVELAGFANGNTFGVYDIFAPGSMVQIFAGANVAGDQAILSIHADGSVFVNFADTGIDFGGNAFGYYLDSSVFANGGLWHSETGLNADGMDHLAAYQGKNIDTIQLPGYAPGVWTSGEYALAWEDLHASVTDADYTDFVVMVESSIPIPEPGTVMLFGLGLLGLGVSLRRKFL